MTIMRWLELVGFAIINHAIIVGGKQDDNNNQVVNTKPPSGSPIKSIVEPPTNSPIKSLAEAASSAQFKQANEQLVLTTCPPTLDQSEVIGSDATLYYAVVPGLLCARVEVENHEGWVGFGISENGAMVGSQAIIGLPAPVGTVLKYDLNGKSTNLVTPMAADKQTLRDTSITQVGDKMVMEFTKLLVEEGEIPISVETTTANTGPPNTFLFARGPGSTLGYHASRLAFNMFLRSDSADIVDTITTTTTTTTSTTTTTTTTITDSPTKMPTKSPSNAPTSSPISDPTNSPTANPFIPPTPPPTPPPVVPNCYVLSESEQECKDATNCQWALDSNGITLCSDGASIPGTNCYVLSESQQACAAAVICQWLLDSNGINYCGFSSNYLPGGSTQTNDKVDCTNVSKQGCEDAINCVWDKRSNACVEIALSSSVPPPSPTPPIGRPPTPRPTLMSDRPGYVDCSDPTLSRMQCRLAPNCEWEDRECIFGSWPVSPSIAPGPTDEIFPTEVPTEMPTTLSPTEEPTVIPTPAPIDMITPAPIDTIDASVEETADCADPGISKGDCNDATNCLWSGGACQTLSPTSNPVSEPSEKPSITTMKPSLSPSAKPSQDPSASPTASPSSSPTISTRPTVSPSASPSISLTPTTPKPTDSPTMTALPTRFDHSAYRYVRPEINDMRFVPWNKLDLTQQRIAREKLKYTKETWGKFGLNSIENLRWSDLSDAQKNAARELGYEDELMWNCWMNHWEAFSWKQLNELKLTKYLKELGWDMNTWNSQYNDPPIQRRKSWANLDEEQERDALHQLCHVKSSYDRLNMTLFGMGTPFARPVKRFVLWEDLNQTTRVQLEQSMGYNELTWNVLGLAPVEQKGWHEFVDYEKDTAALLGIDEPLWDCWMNHYDSYGWQDLVNRGHAVHFEGLGWSELSWNEEIDPPLTDSKSWRELNETEKLHATELCYDDNRWGGTYDMRPNPGPFPFPKPETRYIPWAELSDNNRRIATSVMLYDENTWNNVGTADIEKRGWDDLTEYQQPFAITLGFYERTWDCFQNHYRSTKWSDLPEDVRAAAIALGWQEGSWSNWSAEPAQYSKKWSQLSDEEETAAYALCHFNVTWPGDGLSINLANQYESDQPSSSANRPMCRILLPAVLAIVGPGLLYR